MKIYTIDEKGYIVGIKNVKNDYKINVGDIEGEPSFELGFHYQTGEPKPKTQEQLKSERINELKSSINDRDSIKSVLSEEQLLQLEQDKLELKTLLGY